MIKKIIKKIVRLQHFLIYKKFDFFSKTNQSKFRKNSKANFVVSIASYPKRSHLLPAVFEALNKQIELPLKWIIVLSEEEWPHLVLPKYLAKLVQRGVEIIWVKNNTYAVKKLVPVIEKYPNLSIVTLDDDIIYHKSLLEGLIAGANTSSNSIIGYVGKIMIKKENQLHMFYREKEGATYATPANQVYLIGWGGIYYPPNSLDKRVLDMDAIHRIVPGRGSDIWFWSAAHSAGTNQLCLGVPNAYNLGIGIPQTIKTIPKDKPGAEVIVDRFQKAIDYFGIREKLLRILPNESKIK
jgi:hypothetical protein